MFGNEPDWKGNYEHAAAVLRRIGRTPRAAVHPERGPDRDARCRATLADYELVRQEPERSPDRSPEGLSSAVAGGGLAAVVLAGMTVSVGSVGAHEAGVLLGAIQPTARFLGSSVLTGSATTLALMLTLLGLSHNIQERLADMATLFISDAESSLVIEEETDEWED